MLKKSKVAIIFIGLLFQIGVICVTYVCVIYERIFFYQRIGLHHTNNNNNNCISTSSVSYQYTFYILRVELISSSDDDDKDDEQQDIITRNNKRQQTVKKFRKKDVIHHITQHTTLYQDYTLCYYWGYIANNNGNLRFI